MDHSQLETITSKLFLLTEPFFIPLREYTSKLVHNVHPNFYWTLYQIFESHELIQRIIIDLEPFHHGNEQYLLQFIWKLVSMNAQISLRTFYVMPLLLKLVNKLINPTNSTDNYYGDLNPDYNDGMSLFSYFISLATNAVSLVCNIKQALFSTSSTSSPTNSSTLSSIIESSFLVIQLISLLIVLLVSNKRTRQCQMLIILTGWAFYYMSSMDVQFLYRVLSSYLRPLEIVSWLLTMITSVSGLRSLSRNRLGGLKGLVNKEFIVCCLGSILESLYKVKPTLFSIGDSVVNNGFLFLGGVFLLIGFYNHLKREKI